MNTQIEQEIVSVIQAAKAGGNDLQTFVQNQAPDLINQIIRWTIFDCFLGVIVGTALVWAGYKIFSITNRKFRDDEWRDSTAYFPIGICVAAMCGFGFFQFCESCSTLTKALMAPKLLVVEKIGDLWKNK